MTLIQQLQQEDLQAMLDARQELDRIEALEARYIKEDTSEDD